MTDGASRASPKVQLAGDEAAERQAVGLHAGAGEEDDGVAVAHISGDAVRLGRDPAEGRAGEDDGLGVDDAPERGGLAPAPDGAGLPAALGPAVDQRLHARRVGEPRRLAHGGVHRHGYRQRAAGDEVVDDGGDGIDGDLAVEVPARLRVDGVGHEVLGAEALLDVREVVVGGLDQVGALAPDAGGLGVAVGGQRRSRRLRRLLAGALEGVELVVVDAGTFVGKGHEKFSADYADGRGWMAGRWKSVG
jgi:hypothetical protein